MRGRNWGLGCLFYVCVYCSSSGSLFPNVFNNICMYMFLVFPVTWMLYDVVMLPSNISAFWPLMEEENLFCVGRQVFRDEWRWEACGIRILYLGYSSCVSWWLCAMMMYDVCKYRLPFKVWNCLTVFERYFKPFALTAFCWTFSFFPNVKNRQVHNSWSACSRILIHPEPKRRKWERCTGANDRPIDEKKHITFFHTDASEISQFIWEVAKH